MAVTMQAYEWMNLAPQGDVGSGVEVGRSVNARGVTIPAQQPVDIFVGGLGNNITMPSMVRSTDFVVIDYISCTPYQSSSLNHHLWCGCSRHRRDFNRTESICSSPNQYDRLLP